MPKPARSKQPGRRPTNESLIRWEPEVFAALRDLQDQRAPVSVNGLVNQAVREFCARELGAREMTA